MLVKILSYGASLIGSGKYKAILFSCIAILISMGTAIVIGVVMVSGKPLASTSGTEQTNVTTPQQAQPQASHLQGVNKKAAKQAPDTTAQLGPTQPANPSSQATPSPTNTAATDLILSTNSATITPGNSTTFTVSTSDTSKLSWAVSPETANGLSVTFDQDNDVASSTFAFHMHANQTAPAGTYTFTLTAKDSSRNIALSKTIAVTVAS